MLLSLGEVEGETLLELIRTRLKHLRDVLEIGDHRGPTLLLKVLIVDQPLAYPGLLAGQAATLLSQAGARDQCLVSGRHRQRGVDLALKIDICRQRFAKWILSLCVHYRRW